MSKIGVARATSEWVVDIGDPAGNAWLMDMVKQVKFDMHWKQDDAEFTEKWRIVSLERMNTAANNNLMLLKLETVPRI